MSVLLVFGLFIMFILFAFGLWNSMASLAYTHKAIPQTPSASCRGWSRPDPAVRLRQDDNEVIRIFGFPEEDDLPPGTTVPPAHFGNGGVPILYLRGQVPAYVDYIMGHEWRTRLRTDHEITNTHRFKGGKVILRRDEGQLDEREHCLRMLRCGAVAVRSEVDIILGETQGRREPLHIFGWPARGGVSILRNAPVIDPTQDLRPVGAKVDFEALHEMQERFSAALESIKGQDDMESVCRVIEQAGGQFYENIDDCPEALYLKLLV